MSLNRNKVDLGRDVQGAKQEVCIAESDEGHMISAVHDLYALPLQNRDSTKRRTSKYSIRRVKLYMACNSILFQCSHVFFSQAWSFHMLHPQPCAFPRPFYMAAQSAAVLDPRRRGLWTSDTKHRHHKQTSHRKPRKEQPI
jgi:hypothetical protein